MFLYRPLKPDFSRAAFLSVSLWNQCPLPQPFTLYWYKTATAVVLTVDRRTLPFLKASRLFSICFCLLLSGAEAKTLASSSLIWSFKWVSWSARLWKKRLMFCCWLWIIDGMCFTSQNQLRWKETCAVQSCSWCIFPGCSSCRASVAANAGRSPLAAASSHGSPAALTLSHSAFSPCCQARYSRVRF